MSIRYWIGLVGLVSLGIWLGPKLFEEQSDAQQKEKVVETPKPKILDTQALVKEELAVETEYLNGKLQSQKEVHQLRSFTQGADKNKVPILKRMVLEAEDPIVVSNALRALERLKAVQFSELTPILEDERFRVQQEIVRVIGKIGDTAAIDYLLKQLQRKDSRIRPLTIQALGKLKNPKATQALQAISNDPSASEVDRKFAKVALLQS